MKKTFQSLISFLVAAILVVCAPQVRAANEDQVKAVFLYNLTHFTYWPTQKTDHEDEFVLGIYKAEKFAQLVQLVCGNDTKAGIPIHVKLVSDIKDLDSNYNLLFIEEKDLEQWKMIEEQLAGRPVLTVSDSDTFLPMNGMVALATHGKKVRIHAKPAVIEKAGLSMSAKLLRLATIETE